MKKALERFINNNGNGLFLLDSPTGFGKTTAVLKILRDFLCGKSFQDTKRMFFVTNLKTNLPIDDLFKLLTEDEKKNCARIKAYDEDLIDNWSTVKITSDEIKNSKEYKALNSDIEILIDLNKEKKMLESASQSIIKKQKSIDSFEKKIATVTEPAFRQLVQKLYFWGKSVVDKKKFVRENDWFKKLYPISEMQEKKVIFMTTAKFFSPINLFYRMPFYIYADNILNDSVVFIDEFDSTKKTVLDQIIENSLKINVDIISLFTNIHYVLQSVKFPQALLKMVADVDENDDAEKHKFTSQEILDLNKGKFEDIYKKHHFELLLKSSGFKYKNAFLFDDGNYVTVYSDTSKKHLMVTEDKAENYIKLTAENFSMTKNTFSELLYDIYACIKYFATGVKFLSNNYFKLINTTREGFEHKYSQDEALMTILSTFNLNGENRDYLQNMLTDGRYKIEYNENITRKGFKFTEVEDSNYHDLQSVAHQFNFETTPENLIILMAQAAKVIGVSATASLETVIGNYDIKYIGKALNGKHIEIYSDDKLRIAEDFAESQMIYNDVKINIELVDDLNCFSNKEKCKMLLEKIFDDELLKKYINELNRENDNDYYDLIMVKIVYLYKEVGTKNIKSFLSFLNKLPKINDEKLNLQKLNIMFNDAAKNNKFERFNCYILQSDNFDEEMNKVYLELAEGKKCFVISTYQTVGTGKNIQYSIPNLVEGDMIIQDKERFQKDFDGIYLLTPTNLTQQLKKDAEDKYADLSRYLYQQQSLYLNDKITNGQYRQNIVNGFRRTFFSDYNISYFSKNSDLCCHTAQIVIQAVGRICRCRNKNKQIYIYSDMEVVDRIQKVKGILDERLFNREFLELLNTKVKNEQKQTVENYSKISKKAYLTIRNNSNIVRSSPAKVREWQELRDYVLTNPTGDYVVDKYAELYFQFDSRQTGFSYKTDNRFNIVDIKFSMQEDMIQVSMQDCELPIMLSIPCVKNLFQENKYASFWKKGSYVMSPSLYNQIYKGALGEVVGRTILDVYLGYDVEEIDDYTLYELFDYKIKNLYIDFKHWKSYVSDPKLQIEKIKRKLNKANGEKAIIINIVKRGNHRVFQNIDEDVIEIPYLIDDTNEVSNEMIDNIDKYIIM